MKWPFIFLLLLLSIGGQAQQLKIRNRKADALTGSQFSAGISDTAINLQQREKIIYKAIKAGNVPNFYRKLALITDTAIITINQTTISYYVLPDYIAIGVDTDYFYCPMTPALAQRVANKLKCSLPTRKMVNQIYSQAGIRLSPHPIPPSAAMSTVPVFIQHNTLLKLQRDSLGNQFEAGKLVAGNKKGCNYLQPYL